MNLVLRKSADAKSRDVFTNSTVYDNIAGFWGVVTAANSETLTVKVKTQFGFELENVRVASLEWVTYREGKHLTGERNLPPVNTFVYCVLPNKDYSSAFVLCSGFTRSLSEHADFKEIGKEGQQKRVDNAGWEYTSNNETGTKTVRNKTQNETVKIEVNGDNEGDEYLKLKIQGNEVLLNKDEGISVKTDKKYVLNTEEEITIESLNTNMIKIGNSIDTLGSMISSLMNKLVGFTSQHTCRYNGSIVKPVADDGINGVASLKSTWNKVFI